MSAAGPTCARIGSDRWHFQHGPIDLVIGVDADDVTRERAIAACWDEFQHVLQGLVGELSDLRRPASNHPAVHGPVAQRMLHACAPFADERFITPMAAVAGAVADHLIAVFKRPGVKRAFINNGGDIALVLSPGAGYRVGIWSQLKHPGAHDGKSDPLDSTFTVEAHTSVRGVATSGWRGRSFSLGIADSVTILADNAAAADAAATLIANAVNCECAGIVRTPADQLKDDTDLGALLVTVDVPPLPVEAITIALSRGRAEAERWRDRGLIYAAALFLQGRVDLILPLAQTALAPNPAGLLFEASAA